MKMSAAWALLRFAHVDDHAVRSLRPLGRNIPLGIRLYLVKCRGWLSAGFEPQKMIRSPRLATSPSVASHFADPLKRHARRAVADAGRGVDVPLIQSAMLTATRWASQVVSLRP